MAGGLLDCIILGDSIALGLGQARPDCDVVAESGVNSDRFVQSMLAPRQARTIIISLGVNDGDGVDTVENLRRLRDSVTADTVYWLVAGSNPHTRNAIAIVAGLLGDRLIDVAPLAGPDHIHPDRAGYATLAVQTGGVAGGGGGTTQPPPTAAAPPIRAKPDAFRDFPEMKVWNGPSNLNGETVTGPGRK